MGQGVRIHTISPWAHTNSCTCYQNLAHIVFLIYTTNLHVVSTKYYNKICYMGLCFFNIHVLFELKYFWRQSTFFTALKSTLASKWLGFFVLFWNFWWKAWQSMKKYKKAQKVKYGFSWWSKVGGVRCAMPLHAEGACIQEYWLTLTWSPQEPHLPCLSIRICHFVLVSGATITCSFHFWLISLHICLEDITHSITIVTLALYCLPTPPFQVSFATV